MLVPAALLAATLWVGFRPTGPAPPLGPLLDPVHGVWALARTGELPQQAGAVIAGLGGDVRVYYDRRGVPHIFAGSEADAYRALGYVVARDRLFQMYLQTLAAAGRLTEIGGPAVLAADREMRRLGLPRAAEAKTRALTGASGKGRLTSAYTEGVRAYVSGLSAAELPLEFRLLGVRPEPWNLVDAAYLFGRMGWTLASGTPEMPRALAAARVGDIAAAALFPDDSPIQEPIQPTSRAPRFAFRRLPPPAAPDRASEAIAALLDRLLPWSLGAGSLPDEPRAMASNNWAVAPRRTRDGHALLAGDPHLELTLPSIWYEVHLVVPGTLDVYGVTIPGAPGIVIGFNRDLAWTFTNTGADVLDFYAETVDDSVTPTRYRLDGHWHRLEVRHERYRDRDGRVIAEDTLYFTHRGPMRREKGRWLSMRWTVLEPSNEAAAFHAAARATSVTEFQRAMGERYWAPAQNMLVADRRGTIAIRSTGHFPIRPGDGRGTGIRDGAISASDWRGYLAPDEYPQAQDPAQGFLASANQQPVDPAVASRWMGGEYDPWRALRINALLRADSQVTPEAMRRWQTDPGSARADYFVPFFLRAAAAVSGHPGSSGMRTVDSTRLAAATRLLGEWDRRYTRDDRRAVLFETAMSQLVDRTWDELVDTTRSRTRRVATPGSPVLAELLADSTSVWWDDRRTTGHRETRDEVLATSLVAALDETERRYGAPSGDGWRWERIRHANIWHLLRIRALSALELPVQGGPSTLSPSAGSGSFGPSWRMVVELGPEVRAWGTYPGGQSGNPASARYRDRVSTWVAGRLDSLLVPRDTVAAAQGAVSRLVLHPAR